MWSRTRKWGSLRKFAVVAFAVAVCSSGALFLLLPYDSAVWAFAHFHAQKTISILAEPFRDEHWLLNGPSVPVDPVYDVALIIKTGYGTIDRLPAQLEALGLARPDQPDQPDQPDDNLLVVGDFSARDRLSGRDIVIHDVVAAAITAVGQSAATNSERMAKYNNLTVAVQAGHGAEAKKVARAIGWELDAMKFVPALALAYREMPQKSFYLLLDDDSFIVKSSLRHVLAHLNPSEPLYLGNAIGDFKVRFAHGGSAILLSHAAMGRLVDGDSPALDQAYRDSLTGTWGDKLVAAALMKVGVYLDERYSIFFNGERPDITRIRADRFCSPIVSFHGLAGGAQMADAAKAFGSVNGTLLWRDVWGLLGQPNLDLLQETAFRPGRDHVGSSNEMAEGVESAERCLGVCEAIPECLAWTWDRVTKICHTSPWFIVGGHAQEKVSGLNVGRVRKLHEACRNPIDS